MWGLITKGFNILFAWKQASGEGKKPWMSNTIRALVVSYVALLSSKYAGIDLSAEEQTTILAVIALFMRFISKGQVGFYEDKT